LQDEWASPRLKKPAPGRSCCQGLSARLKKWRADFHSTEAASTTAHFVEFLQKLRGSLALIPATDAVAA